MLKAIESGILTTTFLPQAHGATKSDGVETIVGVFSSLILLEIARFHTPFNHPEGGSVEVECKFGSCWVGAENSSV